MALTATIFLLVLLLLAMLVSFAAASALPPTAKRPHIVFIVADDLGWNDVGWHNPKVKTPQLDTLAREGVRLNNYYVLPVCSPSRSAFMTGYYPFHTGMQHYVLKPMQPTGLPLQLQTLPQRLKNLGYATHMVGKWHLGYCKWEYTPTYRGFDSFYGFHGGENDHFSHHRTSWSGYPSSSGLDFWFNKTVVRDQKGVYSAFTHAKRAEDIIRNHNQAEPLFLYLPFQNVHSPLQVPQEFIKPYAYVKDKNRRLYLAMVTTLDTAIGRVVEGLRNKSMMNDTLLVFTSDNGGPVQAGGNNWPLRGSKHSFFEGGTRASAFIHGTMLSRTNVDYQGLMHAVDWLPTFMEAAGVADLNTFDGKSQWKSLTEFTSSPRDEIVYNIDEIDARAAIRKGNFKLIAGNPLSAFFQNQGGWYPPPEGMNRGNLLRQHRKQRSAPWWCFWCSVPRPNHIPTTRRSHRQPLMQTRTLFGFNVTMQLFDLVTDPTEHHDVSHQFPEVVDNLYSRLQQYVSTLVPSKFPAETQRADPMYFNYTWSPGWCV